MTRYHATVDSRSSAAETFGYLAAFGNAADWDPGVLAGQQLDSGPVGVGTRFRLVVRVLGARMPLTYQVISFVPDREVILAAAGGLLRSTDRIVVTGGADGSTVSYDAEVRLRGPLRVLDLSWVRASAPWRGGRRTDSRGRCPRVRVLALPRRVRGPRADQAQLSDPRWRARWRNGP